MALREGKGSRQLDKEAGWLQKLELWKGGLWGELFRDLAWSQGQSHGGERRPESSGPHSSS